MKIDKSNPWHWLYLAIFVFNTALVGLLRWLWRGRRDAVVLYGHKRNGNLKAIQDYAAGNPAGPPVYFLTLDPAYYRRLQREGQPALLALNPWHLRRLVQAFVLVTDHGLHALVLLRKCRDLQFVDVWHGIPFKGFDADDFRVQRAYDEVWVASERLKRLYVERFGFQADRLKVTGYARTDALVRGEVEGGAARLRDRLGISESVGTVILFAPTWRQDHANRSIFPFGIEEKEFLERLEAFCLAQNATCILRQHLNTRVGSRGPYTRIVYGSYEAFPDAEEILLISDLLICDWSSIAFDYLLLDRPTLFLDVPPPFKKGLSLEASYRFGRILGSLEELLIALAEYVADPARYHKQYASTQQRVRQEIYGRWADGQAATRGYRRLLALQEKGRGSP